MALDSRPDSSKVDVSLFKKDNPMCLQGSPVNQVAAENSRVRVSAVRIASLSPILALAEFAYFQRKILAARGRTGCSNPAIGAGCKSSMQSMVAAPSPVDNRVRSQRRRWMLQRLPGNGVAIATIPGQARLAGERGKEAARAVLAAILPLKQMKWLPYPGWRRFGV